MRAAYWHSIGKFASTLRGLHVCVMGVACKRDIDDLRESPALDILELLARRGACVSYTDPYVPTLRHGKLLLSSVPEAEALASKPDCVVIATDHKVFDYAAIVRDAQLVVDTRNALKGRGGVHIRQL